jgi:hypothetical protein
MKDLSKTAQRILRDGYASIDHSEPRKMKAMKELDAAGLITIESCKNDYGYEWFIVRNKSNIETATKMVVELFSA